MYDARFEDTPITKMQFRRSGSYYYVQPYVRVDNLTWYGGSSYAINQHAPHAIEISWSAASAPGANNGTFEFWVDGTRRYSKTNLDNDTNRIDQNFLKANGQVGYPGTYCFDAFESRSQSAIGLLNGVHGCGVSPEFWEPLSAGELLPIIPFTGTLEITGTLATITTTLPLTLTNLEQGGQMLVITSTETVTITGTISPTEAISGTGWVGPKGVASLLPPRWLMAPSGSNGGSYPGTSLVMDIGYTYDPLHRLIDAVYNGGYYRFEFEYDAVGNRTQMVSQMPSGQVFTTTYGYDIANRLTSVDSVNYTWDANGNLLDDGLNTYTYDSANRLTSMMSMPPAVTFTYNGLGDRMQQTYAGNTTTYLLDIASYLTQVLGDGESTYLYGLGRIGEEGAGGWQYL